ncbi:MAG: biopolymer transporter ExbD, partial [Myxococcales bacterium]|nr:biopolymer transporter ExbD [Myxococcales bacterium]
LAVATLQQPARTTVTVAIDARGAFTVNGARVQDPDLDTVLAGLAARDKALDLIVVADPAAPQAAAIRVTDAAKKAGISNVALRPAAPSPTRPPAETPAPTPAPPPTPAKPPAP